MNKNGKRSGIVVPFLIGLLSPVRWVVSYEFNEALIYLINAVNA
jgi:hypothetical protein